MAGEVVKFEHAAQPQRRSFDEVSAMAKAIVESKLWGNTTTQQVVALMLMAEAEGRHVASAMQDYIVIQGKPSLKAEAMLGRFQRAGGHVRWTSMSDEKVAAIFSHPQCDAVEIEWDHERAKRAGIANGMYRKYPRQMLRARVISEGVRTAFPGALGGMYAPEEVMDFEPVREPQTPSAPHGKLTPPEEAGQPETPRGVSFHDEPSNVPGGFKSLKTIEVDEEQRTDHTADPEWSILSTRLRGNCETKQDVITWWDENKKALKARKPHFAKAFHSLVVLPLADELAETVWEDAPEAAG